MSQQVLIRTRPTLTARRRALGLSAARYLRAPMRDETPLSPAEIRFAIEQGIVAPLPLRRVK